MMLSLARASTRREALTGGMPLVKYLANRGLTTIENVMLGQNLGDFHSGFHAPIGREVLERVPFHRNSDSFVFDSQFLMQCVHLGIDSGMSFGSLFRRGFEHRPASLDLLRNSHAMDARSVLDASATSLAQRPLRRAKTGNHLVPPLPPPGVLGRVRRSGEAPAANGLPLWLHA